MIEYRQGNLLDAFDKGEVTTIAHGVNCIGGFGSGIAGQITERYPQARRAYLAKFERSGWNLGEFQFVQHGDRGIYHLATQENCGNDGKLYADYDAIRTAFTKLYGVSSVIKGHFKSDMVIGIPKIGAGLAGGDWNIIENIINEIFHDTTIYVYCL